MTVAEALRAAGIEAREARLLLAEATGFSEASVLARPEAALPPDVAERFVAMAARRRGGEPVAYILGHREFHGLLLAVNAAVLVPRPETELLVDLALERFGRDARARVLDLGTGSGAIAIAVKKRRPLLLVVAVDSSAAALEVARRNALRNGASIDFRHGRWFEPLAGESFDLVLANPPYVARGDPHLREGDLRFEPREALTPGPEGLEAIREIVAGAAVFLVAGGVLAIEHGFDQAAAVRELLARAGFREIESRRDLAGIERVTAGRAPAVEDRPDS